MQPVLLNGAGVWGTSEKSVLNMVQNEACRFFLGVPKNAANSATRGDMGWLSVFSKQKLEVIRLWCRLKNTNNDRLTKHVFHWSYTLANQTRSRKKTWEFCD